MLATGVGVRDSLTLPDGTRVILGPLSSVTIAEGYGDSDRQVEVRGDAWFDVVHDDAKPFTVSAGGATIVDIGTKFMVRSDAGEARDVISVSVTEGSVSMRPSNDSWTDGVILNAGDNAILGTDGRVVTRPGTVDDDDLAWMTGRLVFRETPLSEVVSSVHRWYGLDLRVGDASLMSRPITATFENETPERVLDVLRLVLGAEIQRRGDTAVVLPRTGGMRSR
jgi:transmembrane sensor